MFVQVYNRNAPTSHEDLKTFVLHEEDDFKVTMLIRRYFVLQKEDPVGSSTVVLDKLVSSSTTYQVYIERPGPQTYCSDCETSGAVAISGAVFKTFRHGPTRNPLEIREMLTTKWWALARGLER